MKTEKVLLLLIPTLFEAKFILDDAEYGSLLTKNYCERIISRKTKIIIVICGFGLISSAITTVHLLNQYESLITKDSPIYLLGICGTFDIEKAPIGSVVIPSEILLHGIGVGEGDSYKSAFELGWQNGSGSQASVPAKISAPKDVTTNVSISTGTALSVTSASSNYQEATFKKAKYKNALIEDMETYSVIVASESCNREVVVVRGVSNQVGEKDKNNWKVQEAMENGCKILYNIFKEK